MNESIKLVAESEAGAIYHDEQNDEWLLDVATKGITMYFDRQEFQEFLQLTRLGAEYQWEVQMPEERQSRPMAQGE